LRSNSNFRAPPRFLDEPDGLIHQSLPRSGASYLRMCAQSPARFFSMLSFWKQKPGISDEFRIAEIVIPPQQVQRFPVSAVRVEISAILLDNENALPQLHGGIKIGRRELRECSALP